jgi:glycosyltransferase involved in cell wall biosynthesis
VERKGLDTLIRALAQLEPGRFQLEIVGDGPARESLRELAVSLGVAEEVRFLGSLDRAEVAERYREADLFTLPSTAESFGNVFAEALASGLPVVATQVGGIPDLVEHGINGLLVAPGDPAGLAQAIRYLGSDPEIRRQMGQRNRAKAEAALDWGQVTSRYLSIYETAPQLAPAPTLVAQPTAGVL